MFWNYLVTQLCRCFIAGFFRAFNILMLYWKSPKRAIEWNIYHANLIVEIFFFCRTSFGQNLENCPRGTSYLLSLLGISFFQSSSFPWLAICLRLFYVTSPCLFSSFGLALYPGLSYWLVLYGKKKCYFWAKWYPEVICCNEYASRSSQSCFPVSVLSLTWCVWL